MPRSASSDPRIRYALLPAFFAAAAGFGVTWLLVAPPADRPSSPAAVLRVRQSGGGRSEMAMDEAVARLLGSESLATALTESGVLGRSKDSATFKMAKKLRESLRVDIHVPDEAGVQEVRIHWVGDPREKVARPLVRALTRQLAAGLPATDPAEPRREYEAARSELAAAETALADARSRFEAVLNAPPGPHFPHTEVSTDSPPKAPPRAVEADDAQLARQRLAELEQRRQALADRLMPEHPEMRALEQKIDELKSALARRPRVAPQRLPVAESPPDIRAGEQPDENPLARSGQLWRTVVEAQNRHAAALAHERACRRSLSPPRDQLVAEIESTPEIAPAAERGAWRRWLSSGLTALVSGGLALALWPRRRQTFASAEEVRAVTRLPVVVVESTSLN